MGDFEFVFVVVLEHERSGPRLADQVQFQVFGLGDHLADECGGFVPPWYCSCHVNSTLYIQLSCS
jgi:hypothetical protein